MLPYVSPSVRGRGEGCRAWEIDLPILGLDITTSEGVV